MYSLVGNYINGSQQSYAVPHVNSNDQMYWPYSCYKMYKNCLCNAPPKGPSTHSAQMYR